jgi:hypothetical protein
MRFLCELDSLEGGKLTPSRFLNCCSRRLPKRGRSYAPIVGFTLSCEPLAIACHKLKHHLLA